MKSTFYQNVDYMGKEIEQSHTLTTQLYPKEIFLYKKVQVFGKVY